MYAIAMVFLGGAAGGLLRYGVSSWCAYRWGSDFPWGTLIVNLTGAAILGAAIGVLTQSSATAHWIDQHALLLLVGLLGSYTTVSSFSLQTLGLLQQGRYPSALINSLSSLFGCPLLFALGYWCCASDLPRLAAMP